jgi:hypothetical protein
MPDCVEDRFNIAPLFGSDCKFKKSRPSSMSKKSAKNVQKQKKKMRRAIPRTAQTRIQGNTAGVRRRLKKLAGQARAEKAAL